jgi:hypothetical protein
MKNVVVVIMVAMVVTGCGKSETTRDPAIRFTIKNIATGVDVFNVDCGRLPKNLGELIVRPSDTDWNGPYLNVQSVSDLVDDWGTAIRYAVTGDGYEIRSAGPDRTFDTLDDITN